MEYEFRLMSGCGYFLPYPFTKDRVRSQETWHGDMIGWGDVLNVSLGFSFALFRNRAF